MISILAIDDSLTDAKLIEECLSRDVRRKYSVTHRTSLQQGLAELAQKEFDAILLDLMLPDSEGLQTFQRVYSLHSEIPIVVLTGQEDEGLADQAVDQGAQDYLVKGRFDDSLLSRSIQYAMSRKRAEMRELATMKELRHLEHQVLEVSNRERRRIGHDLHDSVGQTLTGVNYVAQSLVRRLKDAGRDGDAAVAQKIVDEIRQSLASVRDAIRGLLPVDDDENGFTHAVRELAENTESMFGIRCGVNCAEKITITDHQVADHLFLIVREAVYNAVKHARARHITITVRQTAESLCVEVRDDGVGIDVTRESENGMGTKIMEYRARLIRGTLEITSDPAGTEVKVFIQC